MTAIVRTTITGLAVASGLAAGAVFLPPTTAEAAPIPTMLIAAVHTDDESSATAYYTMRPGVRKVFLWVDATAGGSNTTPLPSGIPSRWNPGEWRPSGNLTTDLSRSNGKFEGSLLNLAALRKADPSLPAIAYSRPSKKFTDGGRAVTVWTDPARGAAVRYGLPQRQVTQEATRVAINDVTLNPTKYGLPASTRWTDIVAPSYYNWSGVGGATCDLYSNPTHGAVNMGVMKYSYPQFSGTKYSIVCQADKSARKVTKYAPTAVSRITHAPRGSLNTYFGWLYRGYGVPLMTTKSGVFSTKQVAVWASAKAGVTG